MSVSHTPVVISGNLDDLAEKLRSNQKKYNLIFAHNGIGKTQLSVAFKNKGKGTITSDNGETREERDTLYFNAYTEDLFTWNNDLEHDENYYLNFNRRSRFFSGIAGSDMEGNIRPLLQRYVDINFRIDVENSSISFFKRNSDEQNIKISRGEETVFIWSFFEAILKMVIDGDASYSWVKYIYVDDPISSLDENNAIAIASDLARLIKRDSEVNGINKKKYVISSHHSLFFNVIYNELKDFKHKSYFLYRTKDDVYKLNSTKDHPFFHHISVLCELQQCVSNFENLEKTNTKLTESKFLKTYHFNMMRAILEKTAVFFGLDRFSDCLNGVENSDLYARLLNIMSHGSYSIYEPKAMVRDNAELFVQLFRAFQTKYQFVLPNDLASAF